MSKPNIWMPLFIGDYLQDTTRLSTEQHGAYLLLIMDYWTNGPLPDDDAALAQVTRLSAAAWKKHRPALARFFAVGEGAWRHKRIDEEYAKAVRFNDKQKANGAKGGRPKKNAGENAAPPAAQACPGGQASEASADSLQAQADAAGPASGAPDTQAPSQAPTPAASQQKPMAFVGDKPAAGPNANPNPNPSYAPSARPAQAPSLGPAPMPEHKPAATPVRGPDQSPSTPPSPSTHLSTPGSGGPGAPAHDPARAAALCQRLRDIGIDAGPHMPALAGLLARFSDERIVAVAELAKARKPDERVHLHYLIPILNEPKAAPAGKRLPAVENFDQRAYGQGGRL